MTGQQIAFLYVKEFGSIIPAKMGGRTFRGQMIPSEIGRRCRQLYERKIFDRTGAGRFTEYFLHPYIKTLDKVNLLHDYTKEATSPLLEKPIIKT